MQFTATTRDGKLREWVQSMRAELIYLLGEQHRDEIEKLRAEELLAFKGKTMERLMAAPGPPEAA